MKNFKLKLKFSLLVPFFLCLWSGLSDASDIVVIVNKSQKISRLSLLDLQYIYKGDKKKWESGEKVELFLPPEESESMRFLVEKVLTMRNQEDLAKFYLKAIFQQKLIVPPEPTESAGEALIRVSSTPGGIAIVNEKDVVDNQAVKVIPLLP